MKRQIRRSVFETNSSSMHSLTVTPNGEMDNLTVDEYENKVITEFGEFGWEVRRYTDANTKLSYLVTMLIETHGDCYSMDELYETEDFKLINEAVANYCNCDGIIINSKLEQWKSYDGELRDWNDHDGYIDHQSVEDYSSVRDFLEQNGCTVTEFIFDKGVILHTDNDNH